MSRKAMVSVFVRIDGVTSSGTAKVATSKKPKQVSMVVGGAEGWLAAQEVEGEGLERREMRRFLACSAALG